MRNRFVVVAAALAVVVVVAAWRSEAPAKGKGIQVTATNTSVKPGAPVTTVTSDYFMNGNKVGSDQVSCSQTGPGPLAVCTAVSVLPKGDIMSMASIAIPPAVNQTGTTAIIGGTGAYSHARGTIDFVQTSTTERTITFHIVG